MRTVSNVPENNLDSLPLSIVTDERPVRVYRNAAGDMQGLQRLSGYRLCYITQGHGEHLINFRSYGIRPGRLFLILPGQVFCPLADSIEKRVLEFCPMIAESHLGNLLCCREAGLLDPFAARPFVDLKPKEVKVLDALFGLLEKQQGIANNWLLEAQYVSLIVLQANQYYLAANRLEPLYNNSGLLIALRKLINSNFKDQRIAPFYANRLGIACRKLNGITVAATGRVVEELVMDRILAEAEALLACTTLLVKEISNELGFADQAHFALFFRKCKAISPLRFREKMRVLQNNPTNNKR